MKAASETARARAEFFGLRNLPFERTGSSAGFFASRAHRQAIDFLAARQHGPGVALLAGEPGVGKTAVVRAFLRDHPAAPPAVLITLPQDGNLNLLREACKRFCSGTAEVCSADDLIRHLQEGLRGGDREPALTPDPPPKGRAKTPLLIVDQSERLTQDSAPALAAIARECANRNLPLSLVLACSPIFNQIEVPEATIEPYVTVRHSIAPLEAAESAEYVAAQVAAAGGDCGKIFEAASLEAIHHFSRGVPAEINLLCAAAMRLAHRAGDHTVRRAHAEAASKRAPIEKSANTSHVLARHSRDSRPSVVSRTGTAWPSTSLADAAAKGAPAYEYIDDDSTPLHAGTEQLDLVQGRGRFARPLVHGNSHAAQGRRELSEIGTGLNDLQRRAANLDAQTERIASLLDALDERIQRAESATARSSEAELRLRTIAGDVAAHAEALQGRMAALLAMSDSAQDVVESLEHLGTSAQALAFAACERLRDVGTNWQRTLAQSGEQAASEIAEKSAGMQAQIEQATLLINERGPKFIRMAEHQVQDAVRDSIAKLTPVRAEVQGLLAESAVALNHARAQFEAEYARAQHCIEQVQSQTADRMIAISTAGERAETVSENLQNAASQAESAAQQATEAAEELKHAREEARSAAAELAKTTTSARHATDTLYSLLGTVEDKAQQLTSHQAAARSLIGQLTDASVAAADAGKDLESRRGELEKLSQAVLGEVAEATDMLARSCAFAIGERERLASQVQAGAAASADLQAVVSMGMTARAQLHSASEEALRQTAQLEEARDETKTVTAVAAQTQSELSALSTNSQNTIAKLREDLQSTLATSASEVRALVGAADVAAQSLGGVVQQSRESAGELQRAAEAATAQAADMQSSRRALVDSHRGLVLDAETLLQRVAMRLESLREGDRQLAQYDTLAEALRAKLAQLEEQLAAAAGAVGQPQRILADAQAYAGQLERVCDVVRKVKTSVSQAALAADERARELTGAEQEAGRRLHELRQDLAAAAQTLAQWVQEADRAQSRLEATIQSCPPIRQTHAAEALKTLGRTASEAVKIGRIGKAHQPALAGPVVGTAHPVSREDEIAKLLAEARKARREVDGNITGRAPIGDSEPGNQALREESASSR